jgi:hypothetical protein
MEKWIKEVALEMAYERFIEQSWICRFSKAPTAVVESMVRYYARQV